MLWAYRVAGKTYNEYMSRMWDHLVSGMKLRLRVGWM